MDTLSIKQSGESAWCESFRIDTKLQDGSERQYFVKVSLCVSVHERANLMET